MSLEAAWKVVEKAFAASPYLGAVLILILWLSLCWKFRLVAIGRRRSLPCLILEDFSLQSGPENGATLNVLNESGVVPKTTGEDDDASHANANSATHIWKIGEIYQIYWTIIAKGQVVRYTTLIIVFACLSLLVMHLAQPRAGVSLLNVANILGVWTFVPLVMLSLLSLVMMLCSAHQLPCDGIKGHKPQTIILFAW